MVDSTPKQSLRERLSHFFLRPSSLSLAAVVAIGMISGLVFWGGFNTGMEATNTLAFCTSCHEMRDTVFKEYKETIHYKNRSGVRAICSDCHVPRDWMHKFVRKVQASQELYGKFITHVVDTPEKFEAHRMELAQNVWATMKSTDSRECRNCHSWDAMDPHRQKPSAASQMDKGQKAGKTCIDCHKGIAHNLPEQYTGEE
jgi:nitrate/TMAO reductase-like tetraheme cytochrome c subunit